MTAVVVIVWIAVALCLMCTVACLRSVWVSAGEAERAKKHANRVTKELAKANDTMEQP